MADIRRIRTSRPPRRYELLLALGAGLWAAACSSSHSSTPDGTIDAPVDAPSSPANQADSAADAGADAKAKDAAKDSAATAVMVSAAKPVPRTTTWSVNYWRWMPDYGDGVTGTAERIRALGLAFLRVGGYNNDVNLANPFDDAALDKAVAYARDIGAEPIIQVPLLADVNGLPPTAITAADMVRYANVTKGYAVKYFSIGNEPDLYATQGLAINNTLPALPGYAPADYCASVRDHVAAMRAVDPTIKIVGPDLSWKYVADYPDNDWLTPILNGCGDVFDVVAIHRYPFSAKQAKLSDAAKDAKYYRQTIAKVRGILQATGQGDKPLALTEMNVAYDKTWCTLDASPGTVGSALWLADSLGTSMELGLWTSAVWAIGDTDDFGMGLVGPAPDFVPRPSYYAYQLFADHFGPTLVEVTAAPTSISAHASRSVGNDATQVIVINWGTSAKSVPIEVTGLAASPPSVTFTLPPTSMAAIELPDNGTAKAWVYGEAERLAAVGPQPLTAGSVMVGDAGAFADGGAGKAAGMGCGTSPDAAFIATAEAGSATACALAAPETTGKLAMTGTYVTANSVHGYGGPWAWKGASSQATICATPLCTTSDGDGFVAVDTVGGAPLSTQPISCSPSLPSSAICLAASMTRDPTYYSIVGVGLNMNQDADGSLQGLPILESITVTTRLMSDAKANKSLRLQLVDMDGNFYCVEAGAWQSGVPTPISSFRKQCWDATVPNAAAPAGTLARHLDVFLPGGLTNQEVSFCLVDVATK